MKTRYLLDEYRVFRLYGMGNCRIKNIKPPCDYRIDGITDIRLLDTDDFDGFNFDGDDLYNNCLVTAVLRSGDFSELETPDTAKYTSSLQNGLYSHTVETFIGELSADTLANLHLATKRRYVAFFRMKSGRYFCFGYDAGATVTYANQTSDGTGALVTLSASSIYPLFEVSGEANNTEIFNGEFLPDFNNGAYCETV